MPDSESNSTRRPARTPLLRNWISLAGLIVAVGSLFSFLLLFVLDSATHLTNPYIGILTYLVAPGFLITGLCLALLGTLWQRRRLKRSGPLPALQINLSRPRDRRILGMFILGSVGFLLVSAVGSYKTYQFTESVQFCGQACHTVMKPELITYEHGPHARVACVECHIGPGATWFVRSKLSGTYQVYATLFNKFPRPIPTPIENLRPAQQTCNQCHWPRKFVGNLDRTFNYFLGVPILHHRSSPKQSRPSGMTIRAYEGRIIEVFGMLKRLALRAELEEFSSLALSQNNVASVAVVGLDGASSILGLVFAIMATETARPVSMPDIVRIDAPTGLHFREIIVGVNLLHKRNGPANTRIIGIPTREKGGYRIAGLPFGLVRAAESMNRVCFEVGQGAV